MRVLSAHLRRRRLFERSCHLLACGGLGQILFHVARASEAAGEAGQVVSGRDLKLITYSFPNGCQQELWNFDEALQPLADHRDVTLVFHGLKNRVAERAAGDRHLTGGLSLFTGQAPLGADKSTGPSLDDVISRHGPDRRFKKPLVMGVYSGAGGGLHRPLNWQRRSWNELGEPNAIIRDPWQAVSRYFGTALESSDRLRKRKLISRNLLAEFRNLVSERTGLSASTRSLMNAQLERLDALEQESLQVELGTDLPQELRNVWMAGDSPGDAVPDEHFEKAFGVHQNIVATAFAGDLSHSASLMFGNSAEDYLHPSQVLRDHDTSHYDSDSSRDVYKQYRRIHMRNLAQLISTLKSTQDLRGRPLIESTAVLVGSEFGDGRNHILTPQPHLLIGGTAHFQTSGGRHFDGGGSFFTDELYAALEQICLRKLSKGEVLAGPLTVNTITRSAADRAAGEDRVNRLVAELSQGL